MATLTLMELEMTTDGHKVMWEIEKIAAVTETMFTVMTRWCQQQWKWRHDGSNGDNNGGNRDNDGKNEIKRQQQHNGDSNRDDSGNRDRDNGDNDDDRDDESGDRDNHARNNKVVVTTAVTAT